MIKCLCDSVHRPWHEEWCPVEREARRKAYWKPIIAAAVKRLQREAAAEQARWEADPL